MQHMPMNTGITGSYFFILPTSFFTLYFYSCKFLSKVFKHVEVELIFLKSFDNSPLIRFKDFPQVRNIDADCFIDDDGQAYLYWGSGG